MKIQKAQSLCRRDFKCIICLSRNALKTYLYPVVNYRSENFQIEWSVQKLKDNMKNRSPDPWFSCISVFGKMPLRCTFCTSAATDVPCQSRCISEVRLQLTSMFKVMDLTNWLALIRISRTAAFSSLQQQGCTPLGLLRGVQEILVHHPKCFELLDSLNFPSEMIRREKNHLLETGKSPF